jgi:hypothetical protein
MTLLETINLLNWIAKNQPNVNGIVESGDIFDLNKDEYQQKYSAFCVTQNTHTVGEEFTTYSFTLFYVDRLTLDKSNKLEIHSTAVQFFGNLIKTIMQNFNNLDWTNGDVTTFTEKFSAECAGAYMTCSITTPNNSLCVQIQLELGEFAPKPYSDDWFKYVERYI